MRKLAALLVSERTDDGAQRCVRSAPSARAWEDKPADRLTPSDTEDKDSDCLSVSPPGVAYARVDPQPNVGIHTRSTPRKSLSTDSDQP